MRVTLVYNSDAGGGGHGPAKLHALLAGAGHTVVRSESVESRGWPAALWDRSDLVVVAGGDGTVQKVFRELAGSALRSAVIPTGSANNIARTLGFSDEPPEEIVADWRDGDCSRFDVFTLRGRAGATTFVESVGGGLFAHTLDAAEREAEAEGEDSLRQGLRLLGDALEQATALDWEIELDGEDLSGRFIGVEAMNIRLTGPNVEIAPDADPGDSLLDLVLVEEHHAELLAEYVARRLDDDRPDPPALTVRRGRHCTILPPRGTALRVDDSPYDHPDGMPITIGGSSSVHVFEGARLRQRLGREHT